MDFHFHAACKVSFVFKTRSSKYCLYYIYLSAYILNSKYMSMGKKEDQWQHIFVCLLYSRDSGEYIYILFILHNIFALVSFVFLWFRAKPFFVYACSLIDRCVYACFINIYAYVGRRIQLESPRVDICVFVCVLRRSLSRYMQLLFFFAHARGHGFILLKYNNIF
jgi:hypothetical protein